MVEHLTNMQQWSNILRKERLDHLRMCWEQHVAQLNHKGYIVKEYMMSLQAHSELVQILRPYLQQEYNSHSTEPIAVEHIVAAGL